MNGEQTELAHFGVVDYIILVMILVISLGIGIYHGIRGNKTTNDFLLASKSLSPIPVAASLIVSFVSTVSILGYSAEAYAYGLQMYWLLPGFILGLLLATQFITPVFYELQIKSIYEYIFLRFKSPTLKFMMLAIRTMIQVLLLGIHLYSPLLALSVVTPISPEVYILVTGVVVTVYCSVGGMKAVVWTDLFQMTVILIGVILITVSALLKAGGLSNVWSIAGENGRLGNFDMRIGLHERHTAINTFVLGATNFVYLFAFTQASLQRIITQRSLRNAKGVLYASLVGMSLVLTLLFLGGLGIYTVYHGCDPLTLGLIQKRDQITPFYIMQHLGFLTGVPGLFVACLFSGTLSSISSVLNTVPTVLWNDLMAELQFFQKASEKAKLIFIKLLTMSLGLGMIGLTFLASRSKGIIQVTITVSSIASGPITGVLLMGIAMPIVGKKGAIAGFLTSFGFMSWIGIGTRFYGERTPFSPLHTHLCENSNVSLAANVTTEMPLFTTVAPEKYHPLWFLYNISYTYFCSIGILVCVIVGLAVTFATGSEDLSKVKPEHVIHCLRRRVGTRDSGTSAEMESILKDAINSKETEPQKIGHVTHTTSTNVTQA